MLESSTLRLGISPTYYHARYYCYHYTRLKKYKIYNSNSVAYLVLDCKDAGFEISMQWGPYSRTSSAYDKYRLRYYVEMAISTNPMPTI